MTVIERIQAGLRNVISFYLAEQSKQSEFPTLQVKDICLCFEKDIDWNSGTVYSSVLFSINELAAKIIFLEELNLSWIHLNLTPGHIPIIDIAYREINYTGAPAVNISYERNQQLTVLFPDSLEIEKPHQCGEA